MQTPPSSNPRRLLSAALATLVIGAAGVLVILMMVPPTASSPPQTSGGRDSGESGDAATSPAERIPFTSPTPAASHERETKTETQASVAGPSLTGRVLDSGGKPISGAQIKLALTSGGGPRGGTTRTGDAGEFAVRGLSPGTWRLSASAEGYRPLATTVIVPRAQPLELVLEDDRGLRVSVTDPGGVALEGARVTLRVRSHALPGHRSGSTTADGTVTLRGILASAPDWSGRLMVHQTDYLPHERLITMDDLDRGELQVVLEKGGELRLRIVSPEGRPVRGALVALFREDAREEDTETRRLRSVSSGEVHFRNLPPGSYSASVTTSRDGQALARNLTVVAGPAADARELPLARGEGSLTIRAVAHDGEALSLCKVRLTPSNAPEERTYWDGVTDEQGICQFEGLTPGTYDVEVGGGKFTTARRVELTADGSEFVVNVDRPGSISGRVELPEATGGYAIRVSGSDGMGEPYERIVRFSAARRAFTLRYMPRGTYTLDLLVDGKTVATIEGIEVKPGEKTEGVTFGAGEG